jgi:hypothetical protein
MMIVRRSAASLIRAVARLASPSTQDWARAMLAELDSIGSDWVALLWALGSVRLLFVGQTNHLRELSDVPAAAKALANRMNQRTWSGSIMVSGMALFFGLAFLRASDAFAQVGYALIVAAMLYMLFQLVAGRPRRIPAYADLAARTAQYRCELERERDFHRGYWFWSRFAVMLPGFTLLCVGSMRTHPSTIRSQMILLALFLAFGALSIPNNLVRARNYARQIQDLDLLED